MNDEEFNEDGTFSVCLDNIIAGKEVLAITKFVAMEAKHEGYITVGRFLQQLSDHDLQELMGIAESAKDELNDQVGDLLLIAEILAKGEGLEPGTLEDVTKRMNVLIILLTIESLHRKGMVRAFHDNMSLGEDSGDKMIVERVK